VLLIPKITLTDRADSAVREILLDGVLHFSEPAAGPPQMRPLVLLISDPDNGAVIGGLWGRTSWSFLFVELLFVPAALRGRNLGSRLLRDAEEEASRRGCHGVWLDTFSFQAPDFYLRRGYVKFGTIDDYPLGHSRFFLSKILAGPVSAPAMP
jgi:GNAT superfamily N-acetyltransferase